MNETTIACENKPNTEGVGMEYNRFAVRMQFDRFTVEPKPTRFPLQ